MIAAAAVVLAAALAAAPEQNLPQAAAPAAPPKAAASQAPGDAAAPAQPSQQAREAQEAIRAAMARELPALEPKPFKTPAGISGAVEAAAPPQVAGGDVEELTIPIGTAEAISCSTVGKRLDAAAAIRSVLESMKEKVKVVAVQLTDVVAVEGSPLALGVAVYQAPSEKGPMVGLLKLGVYAHDGHSMLCLHDEPGYKETFDRIVKGLAASLKGGGEDESGAARFAEISVMRIGSTPVGFTARTVTARDGGGRTLEEHSCQLIPRGPADLVAVDGFSREESDAKDLLAEAVYVHVSDGEVSAKIAVTRQKDGRTYGYEGEKDGKKLAGTFKTKAGLSTEFWFARRLAATAPVPKKPLVHEAYSHEANPAGAVPVSYTVVAASPRRVALKLGPVAFEAELDANGLFDSGELPVGPAKLVFKRIFSRGTP